MPSLALCSSSGASFERAASAGMGFLCSGLCSGEPTLALPLVGVPGLMLTIIRRSQNESRARGGPHEAMDTTSPPPRITVEAFRRRLATSPHVQQTYGDVTEGKDRKRAGWGKAWAIQ